MEYIFNTRLRGNIALTDSYHTNLALQKDNTLYKFIWVQSGSLQLEIDHVPTTLVKGEIIPLTPLHHIEFKTINGEYLTLLFNSKFQCDAIEIERIPSCLFARYHRQPNE